MLEEGIPGESLIGEEYKPLFPYFAEGRTFRVLGDSYVTSGSSL